MLSPGQFDIYRECDTLYFTTAKSKVHSRLAQTDGDTRGTERQSSMAHYM